MLLISSYPVEAQRENLEEDVIWKKQKLPNGMNSSSVPRRKKIKNCGHVGVPFWDTAEVVPRSWKDKKVLNLALQFKSLSDILAQTKCWSRDHSLQLRMIVLPELKQHWASTILGWETARELEVLLAWDWILILIRGEWTVHHPTPHQGGCLRPSGHLITKQSTPIKYLKLGTGS